MLYDLLTITFQSDHVALL